jgi:hypothetical protein
MTTNSGNFMARPIPPIKVSTGLLKLPDTAKMSREELVVYTLIKVSTKGDPITQRTIARSASWLGCHPQHEADLRLRDGETTLRKVRQVVRDLRLNHYAPILSHVKGYWLATHVQQIKDEAVRLERTARAAAKALLITFHTLQAMTDIKSDYFEQQKKLLDDIEEPKKPKKPEQGELGL